MIGLWRCTKYKSGGSRRLEVDENEDVKSDMETHPALYTVWFNYFRWVLSFSRRPQKYSAVAEDQ
jgi:hypothetical protein